ncbi:DUF938 domain-containing protein [Bradymonas sediminis]|uniref:Methylase n=1 Tax=Bradymonas sediminis TaxID=1548548 RepID=A0A2Z4FQZ5_9DELT|nr:DUF938 domain-containing protein [Bradymonas sediminis]AWV91429.1 methylase [Bradymonas sediminis]TDP75842.1 uncharacterized protein DUF938 [Bradymonas sediminis]
MKDNLAQRKAYSPSCERNRDPILALLKEVFADKKYVLEIGSGTGQHAVYFGERLAHLRWQPSNQAGGLDSVSAWVEDAGLPNVNPPVALDLFEDDWSETLGLDAALSSPRVDALVAINVIHIAPWEATEHLFRHAEALLDAGGVVFLYGPYRYADRALEPSNENFDAWLRRRDPASGIRDFEAVNAIAESHGFERVEDRAMPANNRSIWWRKLA